MQPGSAQHAQSPPPPHDWCRMALARGSYQNDPACQSAYAYYKGMRYVQAEAVQP